MRVAFANFFSKNISVYAIINDQSFNDTLTNDVISFEQLGPGLLLSAASEVGYLLDTKFILIPNIIICNI